MIKTTTLILALITLATSFSYLDFQKFNADCRDTIKTCDIDFYSNPSMGVEEIQCAQDVKKAEVCFTNFKQCFPQNEDAIDAQMPVVCWQCFMDIDSDSLNYNKFVSCLRSKGENYLLFTLLLLAFLFMA